MTKRSFKKGKLGLDRLRKFVGGKGVGLSILMEQDKSEDPLDPANPLIFVTGPLTGTIIQTSGRSALVTRSPLTGGFLDSHAGGHFGPALRRSGWDYVTIRGSSNEPVYLVLSPEGVEFKEAEDLWGLEIFEAERKLKETHLGCKIAVIGPAGENLVRYAAIGTESFRHYGRGGAGAVMGSKNLKALVATGGDVIPYNDRDGFQELASNLLKDLADNPNARRRNELGTMMWIRMGQEEGGFLPTRNFREGKFEDYESITAESMRRRFNWKSKGCYGCGVIQCSKISHWDGREMEGPEYETTAFLGSNLGIGDPEAILESNWLCDRYGLDTISTGVTLGFAMECYENGIITKRDTDGLELEFGNPKAVHGMIEKIAQREGLGDLMAEGTRQASRELGEGTDEYAIQIAGMEISGVNPLGSYSMALSLATADFASHTRLWTSTDEMNGNLELEGLPNIVVRGQNEINARNCLIVCDFLPYGLKRLSPFLEAATGVDYTHDDLMKAGERIQALSRLYNLRTGRCHKDDTLPTRFFKEKSFSGLMVGKTIPRELFQQQVQEVFSLRGWDSDGRPTLETMRNLGIEGYL